MVYRYIQKAMTRKPPLSKFLFKTNNFQRQGNYVTFSTLRRGEERTGKEGRGAKWSREERRKRGEEGRGEDKRRRGEADTWI